MMYARTLSLCLLLPLGHMVGCASITSGKNQPLSVETKCDNVSVAGAACSLTNSKGKWFVETPGSVVVNKAYGDLVVECKKEGFATAGGTFQSSANGGVWGNVIAGGIIGYAIDSGTGAGFDYPTQMTVSFAKPCDGSVPVPQ
jgi:hypothetical protein